MKSLNKEATCYRNPHNPNCIDLALTSSPRSFFYTEIQGYQIATNQSYLFLKQHFPKQDLKKWCIGIWKKYFDTVDVNKITDNKTFWVNIQPLFPEQRKFANKITLEDSEKNIITDDTLVSEELSNVFSKMQQKL